MSTFRNTILTIKLIFSLLVVTLTSVKELKSQTPTQITNWTELDAVRNNLSGNYILMNDIDANSSGYSTLASATANSNQGWVPLGNSSTPFTGTFNGNGKKIEGMVIQRSNVQRMGLFGQTDGATIQNLGLINPTVEITGSGFGLGSNVGSLVGLADDGTNISNCYADGGSVKAEGAGIGGLIGQLSNSSLINSFAIVAVDGPQDQYSAGLVGVNTSSSITNCYAAGSVVLNQVNFFGNFIDYSKGLAQNNGGTITNSFYDATTTGQSTGGGTGLTTSQMQQQATFTNWDFQCETTNGTQYIWGINEGNDYPVLSIFGYTQTCANAVTVSGSAGANGSFPTLKAAFDAINASTQSSSNDIEIEIFGNTAERATAVLNEGLWNTLVIYSSAANLSIKGNLAAPLVELNGADRVTTDGRMNRTGTTKSLVIENENTSLTTGNSTIRFIEGAQNNTIRYAIIRSAAFSDYANETTGIANNLGILTPALGAICFHNGAAAGGNSNNIVEYCDLTNSKGNRPYALITSVGSNTFANNNQNNIIRYNHFFDFEAMRQGAAIITRIGTRQWEITDNHFFQPTTVTYKGNANVSRIVSIQTGTNYKINRNVFGGTTSNAGGGKYVIAHATTDVGFTFISVNSATTGGVTEIKNNIFRNIDWSGGNINNSFISGVSGHPLVISDNEIGVQNANGDILLRGESFRGIITGPTSTTENITDTITRNTIGGIEHSVSSGSLSFYGIYSFANFTWSANRARNAYISNNVIGSPTQSESIKMVNANGSESGFGMFFDFNGVTRTVQVLNNTISNLRSESTNNSSQLNGIKLIRRVVFTATNNTISNLSSNSLRTTVNSTAFTSSSAIVGINSQTTESSTILGNTLHGFSLTSANAPGQIIGITRFNGDASTSNEIHKNFIHSFSIPSPGASGEITGIFLASHNTTLNVSNNIIRLGGDLDYSVTGIRHTNTTGNIYFNTIYIDGSVTSASQPSYCMYLEGGTTNAIKNIRNNILENVRSTATGATKHYAIGLINYTSTANTTLDYNNYRAIGTDGVIGFYNSSDETSATFQSTTWNQNSLSIDPDFDNAGGTAAVDYETTGSLPGTPIAAVPQDFFGNNRNLTTTRIGAYEEDNCIIFGEAPTVGDGLSVGTAYEIETFENLLWIAEDATRWDKYYIQTADINAAVTKTSDICFGTTGWTPIGNSSTKFTGSYNGDGHTISNLFINRPNQQRIALFGETNGATIERLGLVDPDITVTGTGSFGQGSNVGSLVGFAGGTSISQCFASGGSVTAGGSGVGGLIGQLSGSSSLTNSYAVVAVEGGNADVNYSAGLVGVNSSSTITNCYAAGSVALKQYFGITLSRGLTQGSSGINNSFYDATTTGQSTGGGTGLTTSQMQQQATFTNWDFQCETTNGTDNIWGIDEGESYPVLSVFGYIQECLGSWVGSVSSDWNTAGNWANNLVPIPNIPINIDANAQNDLVLDQNRDVGNVTFNAADKKIVLGDYNLKINGQINDVNAANYTQTNGSGSLITSIANATSFVFPVGNATYNPVTLTNKSGAADVFSAKVRDEVLVNGTAGSAVSEPHVGVTWDIDKGNPNDEDGIDLVFQWNASQEVGTLTDYTLNHHNGSAWEIALGNSGAVSGTPKTMTHTGYTCSFSPFAISGSDVTPLPVEWYEFSAKAIENQVVLNWSTISETNSQYFEVQHAQDAQNWTTIDMVQASVNTNEKSNYHFIHKNPNQINFYRIKQVDWDGNYSLSAMQTVVFRDRQSANMPKIYPNPSMGSVTIDWEGHAVCDILDMHGRTVFQKAFENTLHIDSLKQGVYLLYIKTNQDTFKSKLIITNQ